MTIEIFFKPNESNALLAFEPKIQPGLTSAVNGFVEYIPLVHCEEDNSGGSVCFVEEGYMEDDGDGHLVLPSDWITEQNNYHEIPNGGRHMEPIEHQEWGEGTVILVHRPT